MPLSSLNQATRSGRHRSGGSRWRGDRRSGFAVMEAMVAAGVVLVLLAVITPTVVRSARVWRQTRHFQFACDELSSQMDQLVSLPADDREAALESLTLPEETRRVLGDATLDGELLSDEQGTRLVLAINWLRIGDPPPVRLMAWLDPLDETARQDDASKAKNEESRQDGSDEDTTDGSADALPSSDDGNSATDGGDR